MAHDVRFAPGSGVGLVGPASVTLLSAEVSDPFVAHLVTTFPDGPSVDGVLDAALSWSLDQVPDFGSVRLQGSDLRLVVRGDVVIEVETSEGVSSVTAAGARTWAEWLVSDVRRVRLSVAGTDELELSFTASAGVLPVATVELVAGGGSSMPDRGVADEDVELGGGQGTGAGEAAAVVAASTIDPSDGADGADGAGADVAAVDEDHGDAADERIDESTPSDDAGPDDGGAAVAADDDPGPGGEGDPGDGGDGGDADEAAEVPSSIEVEQFGGRPTSDDTIAGYFDEDASAEAEIDPEIDGVGWVGGAVAPGPNLGAVAPGPGLAGPVPAGAGDEETDDGYDFLFGATRMRTVEEAAVRVDSAESDAPGGLISSVPGIASPEAAGAPGPGVHDGHTVALSDLRAEIASAGGPAAAAPAAAGTILAVLCPAGHPNPLHAGTCRVCAAAVPNQQPTLVPRPVLGRLRLPDGRSVDLVRSVVLGRSPRAEARPGEPAPEPIVVTDNREVSGTHVEIRVEEWQILVVDRRSTNGTVVQVPGRPPQLLRPDEPANVPIGTVVSLAGELDVIVEAAT